VLDDRHDLEKASKVEAAVQICSGLISDGAPSPGWATAGALLVVSKGHAVGSAWKAQAATGEPQLSPVAPGLPAALGSLRFQEDGLALGDHASL